MTNALRPQTLDQLRDAVAACVADGATLEIAGLGSKRGFGRPMQTARILELSQLAGVRSYEPAELVLTAASGTPLADIEALLKSKNQMLAFEPPDLGALYGSWSAGTLGGAIAANLAGPRRIKSGAARDHFLGAIAVSGRGEVFKAGGKVVKNVTGYDLCKLLAGSFGTLAAMEEVTVKVVPAPAKSRTVLLLGLSTHEGVAALTEALNSPHEVSGAAYLPAVVAARSGVDYVRKAATSVTAIRVEGTPVSVEARCRALCSALSHLAAIEELHTMNSAKLWREIRDVAPLLPDADKAIWRVSVPPAAGPAIIASLPPTLTLPREGGGDLRRDALLSPSPLTGEGRGGGGVSPIEYFFDWGGGLAWIATDAVGDAGAAAIRAAVKAAGSGHATLMRAAPALRAAVPVFEPPADALAALSARVKEQFDPRRVLNPGRIYAGI